MVIKYKVIVRDNQDYGREYGYTNRRHALRDAKDFVLGGYRGATKAVVYDAATETAVAKWANVNGRAVKVNC